MSEELKKLENRAASKCITDHEHIDKIIRYMLSLPFSYFRQDKCMHQWYKYLGDSLSSGFGIFEEILDRLSLEEILMMIGYEPGISYFNPPDRERRGFDKKYNAAGDSYALALMLDSLSKKNIRIKEFMHIELSAYTDYLKKIVKDEYRNNLILSSTCFDILYNVETFKRETFLYMDIAEGQRVTLGDLISKALAKCGMSWRCAVKPLEQYCDEILEGYARLNSLFMDSLRMPLVRVDRERFLEIITTYSIMPTVSSYEYGYTLPAHIDYDTCYEPGGIKQ